MIKVITKAAYRCGDVLASPWTILLFALVSLTALPQTVADAVAHGDITVIVGWFSQNFVQLVSLAVLAFIADRQGRAAQKRGDEMYDWLSELHTALHGLHGKADAQLAQTAALSGKADAIKSKADAIHEDVTAS